MFWGVKGSTPFISHSKEYMWLSYVLAYIYLVVNEEYLLLYLLAFCHLICPFGVFERGLDAQASIKMLSFPSSGVICIDYHA